MKLDDDRIRGQTKLSILVEGLLINLKIPFIWKDERFELTERIIWTSIHLEYSISFNFVSDIKKKSLHNES